MSLHHHDHPHHHQNHPKPRSSSSRVTAMLSVLAITAIFMVVELVFGFLTNSIALFSDALHMLADASGLGLAALTIWLGQKRPNPKYTFGYHRAEALGAFVNSLALVILTVWVLTSAIQRLGDPPPVKSQEIFWVGAAGLGANLLSAWILHRSEGESLAVRGALLHVLSDALGSLGVIVSAILVSQKGWVLADPIASIFISVLVIIASIRLFRSAIASLMDTSPSPDFTEKLRMELSKIPGVDGVHDIHAWSTGTSKAMATVHLVSAHGDHQSILKSAIMCLRNEFGVEHVTIQIEKSDFNDCCSEPEPR